MEEIRMIYLAEDNTPTPRAGYGCGYACQAGFFCPGGFICNKLKREEISMEEINVSVYSDDAPTPRAGILCGVFCISGILFC